MMRGALCGGLLLLGGCVVVVRENVPPVDLSIVRQFQQGMLKLSRPPDIYVAPERFAQRLRDFSINLRRTLVGSMPPGDGDMELLLRLFALTLEEVPESERVGASVAAEEMYAAAASMRGPWLPGSPPSRREFVHGLSVGVETLLALAEGPYGGATSDLDDRTAELASSYQAAMEQPQPIRYEVALEVLRRSLFVLKAIEDRVSAPAP
ncbi:hypothetical protein [Polyangium sp. y55x31]|uniref:hypothetical protein n=1 Tax=Polyangium sp. y55x31 TaxID=3042688 RepID=UPI002482E695|nr:hypothetical protein [Polyangium sp. y55x31]MDI1478563.1 hypothetical protein [Polyangium sp. y55x31]